LTGLILMVFAGMFHLYRHGLNEAKKIPTPPPQEQAEHPKPLGGPEPEGKLPPQEQSSKSSPPPAAPTPQIKTTSVEDIKDPTVGKFDLNET